jgi:hypothetical protein
MRTKKRGQAKPLFILGIVFSRQLIGRRFRCYFIIEEKKGEKGGKGDSPLFYIFFNISAFK